MGATPAVAVTMVAGARTAVRPVDGELAGWNPVVLAGVVGREVLDRAGLDAGVLDEVVVGCCDPVGAAGPTWPGRSCWPPGGRSRSAVQ
ncbi:MAG: hypothetical protein F4118_01005 [Acidimicrobiaceae bacterium]|nr:hypothetical protein [Acidimicrobiaceae bacterium]